MPLTIGQLARRCGLSSSAIRYYEARGVLPEPAREGGQRRYGAEEVRRIEILKVAKSAGFSLDEVASLLRAEDASGPSSEALRQVAGSRLEEVQALIVGAHATREWLLAAAGCSCATLDACALFAADRGCTQS